MLHSRFSNWLMTSLRLLCREIDHQRGEGGGGGFVCGGGVGKTIRGETDVKASSYVC